MLRSSLAITTLALAGMVGAVRPALARPAFPLTSIEFQPTTRNGQGRAVFVVPDRDVSRQSDDSLRRYDLHLAKMFELTLAHCDQLQPYVNSVTWQYLAGNGNLDLGQISINCQQAQNVATAYGLGTAEPTTVIYRATGTQTTEYVPILNLNGNERSQFSAAMQQFRPLGVGGPSSPQPVPEPIALSPTTEQLPISSIRFLPAVQGGQARGLFIVPDQDTARPAYGGSLRRYDVHLAKMFEVANIYCSNGWNSVEWHYFAGNGSVNMGRFVMGCNLVKDIVSAYGLGRKERTVIAYGYGNNAARETTDVPVLNITGDKIPRFVRFAKQFRPSGDAQRIDVERR